MSKEGSHSVCPSVILIDSVFKIDQNYYPQVFSEECKYIIKVKKISKYDTVTIEHPKTATKSSKPIKQPEIINQQPVTAKKKKKKKKIQNKRL